MSKGFQQPTEEIHNTLQFGAGVEFILTIRLPPNSDEKEIDRVKDVGCVATQDFVKRVESLIPELTPLVSTRWERVSPRSERDTNAEKGE